MPAQILIVDDDPAQRRLLEAAAEALGHGVVALPDGRAALDCLAAPDGGKFDLMILDLVMPELDGMGVLERLKQTVRTLPVIVMAGQGSIDQAAGAVRAGATDFLLKPAAPERIGVSIENALRLGALENELARTRRFADNAMSFNDMVAESVAMTRALELARRAAGSPMPILLEGERGTGKERIARAIHGSGDRKSRPFVALPCGMTASDEIAAGMLQARGGTLFLKEIGDLSADAQAALLRVLQEGEIEPAGGRRPVRADFRLMAATRRDLIALVKQGLFREELFYRLNVFPIRMPPLRERPEDIPELVQQFVTRFAAEEGKRGLHVTPESLNLLVTHAWPGNIRQMENAVFRATALAEGTMLTPAEFPRIAGPDAAPFPASATPDPSFPVPFDLVPPIAAMPSMLAPQDADSIRAVDAGGDIRPLVEIEAEAIRLALARYRGRMATVARKLGIGRSTLYRKLKELGIAEADGGSAEGKIAAQ